MTVKILDCTFRDGGYYNNWDFSDELFSEYLSVFGNSPVQLLEVGFRGPSASGFRGAHAYTTDQYLETFSELPNVPIGVMVNASELISGSGDNSGPSRLFKPAASSPVSFVRIATHLETLDHAISQANDILELGYEVAINLMQMSEVQPKQLSVALKKLENLPLMAFYLADSLGSMTPERTASMFSLVRDSSSLALGIHAHDNLGLALENTRAAVECGASYVDGTLRGMGRGPGNAKTEELALYFRGPGESIDSSLGLIALSETTWSEMQSKLGWGTNIHYFLSGLKGVHPTYVQEILADNRFDKLTSLRLVEELGKSGASKYSEATLQSLGAKTSGHTESNASPIKVSNPWKQIGVRDAIIIGPGLTSKTYSRQLHVLLENNQDALVLSVNDAPSLGAPTRCVKVFSHRRHIDRNIGLFAHEGQRILVPPSRIKDSSLGDPVANVETLEFDVGSKFDVSGGYVESPVDNVFAFAAGASIIAGASRVILAGFDGIGGGDQRDFDMIEILSRLQLLEGIDVISVTPTKLPILTISALALHES